jgi:hypothetical protein
MAESSPSCSNTRRMAAAWASVTTNMAPAWTGTGTAGKPAIVPRRYYQKWKV